MTVDDLTMIHLGRSNLAELKKGYKYPFQNPLSIDKTKIESARLCGMLPSERSAKSNEIRLRG
jgi:hypothetical protein